MIHAVVVMVCAALLETGGVALVRLGLDDRLWILLGGALSLVIYGMLVNQAGLDFGRLMGTYIAVFFVVSQLIAIVLFRQTPAPRTLMGGALIIAGGLTILT